MFENIAIRDLTNKALAAIPVDIRYPANIDKWENKADWINLDRFDLVTTFRYWKGLREGIASRNATITSGTMEVSGGSRLNYRSNIKMYPYNNYDFAGVSFGGFVSGIDIHEG